MKTTTIRIGYCQLECQPVDFDANLAKLVAGLEWAARERVAIVCFPECFLTGYWNREQPARRHAFAVDSAQMRAVLEQTKRCDTTCIVGFNERRGRSLYNTALVARAGRLLGTYSKCSAYMPFHKQGRDFPVFEHDGVKFGVVICSDGGYIEPTRILALKGARIIFAPHANYLAPQNLLAHFTHVRADHMARAVENGVWFVRSNNVITGRDPATKGYTGVGYGDSYIVDPHGEILIRSRRHQEDFIFADVDPRITDVAWKIGRSRWSAREFGQSLRKAAAQRPPPKPQ
jgi:predicted amidohydrolase